jgi:uncharacterized damage-inducible protein DinB
MSEVARILDQIHRAWDGDAWHGPPLHQLVADVAASTAHARPIPGVHSIAEIVLHVAFWKDIGRRRLAGEVILPTEEDAWPKPNGAGEAAWLKALSLLRARHLELTEAVACLAEDRLNDEITGKEKAYSAYVLIHGLIQHDLYHAGQIAMLKKAVTGN